MIGADEDGGSNLLELEAAVRDTLQRRGVLDKLRGRLRAEVFKALNPERGAGVPEPPKATLLINALIQDYLRFNHYDSTLSVFEAEVGPSVSTPVQRAVIMEDLGLEDEGFADIPLLYGIMEGLKRMKESRRLRQAEETAAQRRSTGSGACLDEEGRPVEAWAAENRQDEFGGGLPAPIHFST